PPSHLRRSAGTAAPPPPSCRRGPTRPRYDAAPRGGSRPRAPLGGNDRSAPGRPAGEPSGRRSPGTRSPASPPRSSSPAPTPVAARALVGCPAVTGWRAAAPTLLLLAVTVAGLGACADKGTNRIPPAAALHVGPAPTGSTTTSTTA